MEGERALSRPLHDRSRKRGVEHSAYGVPTSLNLGCKIFLSHSGNDKEFVRFLHEKLCSRYHDNIVAFFDAKNLPKVEAISMENILGEARRSHLGVLVLTEAFFVQTPNPMLELEAFVASEVRLLPLFFGMNVKEFKEKRQTCCWEEHWRTTFAKKLGGKRSVEEVIVTWRHALDLVTKFSGLEYEKMATNHLEYIQKIVDEVTFIIPSNILFSEEGVCGKDSLCQMVDNMYKECAKNDSGLTDVVGIHGFSGLGKTTLCKCLCDFYFTKFNGKVCYINIGPLVADQASSQKPSFSSRMQYVLSRLEMYTNNDFFDSLDIAQVKNWFKKKISSIKDSVFLAIDNILPELHSQEEVEFYLSCKFSKGSKIFITSRSESILTNLVSQQNHSVSAVIEYMPALEFKVAKEIFMNEFPSLSEFEISKLEDGIKKCVNMCTIHRIRYHPLMLKSLAALIKWNRSSKDIDWKKRFVKLCSEGITDKDDAWEKVYDMLDMTYALLNQEAQRVFLDLVLFYSAAKSSYEICEWIEKLYSHLRKKEMDKIILQLKDLCFIEKRENCRILNLMVNYGKYKASQGELKSEYVVLEDGAPGLDDTPRRARTVSISRCGHHMVDLRNVEGIKALHIVGNAGLHEVLLSRASITRLRSLIVRVPKGTSLFCTIDEDWPSTIARMSAPYTDGCRQWVDLEGDICFRSLGLSKRRSLMSLSNVLFNSLREVEITSLQVAPDLVAVLGGLRKLELLKLSELPGVRSIDVTTCSNLKVLDLYDMPRLELIKSGSENSKLEKADILFCPKLLALTSIPAHSETEFTISSCESLDRISFGTMSSHCAGALSSRTRPGHFLVEYCRAVTNIDGLSQYTGSFCLKGDGDWQQKTQIVCRELGLKLDAGIDSSICKARIEELELTEYNSAGARLACARRIALEDAQHAGLLISALFKAQPEDLQSLRVYCKEGVDCGCDQNVPHFGPLPSPRGASTFGYRCRQVKDLASLAQWHVLQQLDLEGCTNVEVWPDFAAMNSLETLDLSFTSLKEWPTGVLCLSRLCEFNIEGCRQLPAEELIKVAKFALQPDTLGNDSCIEASFAALMADLWGKRRDRCSVADALDVVYPEFVALFDQSYPSVRPNFVSQSVIRHGLVVLKRVIQIMYDVCFGEVGSVQDKLHIRRRMRSLLCSERFLAFPFRACSQDPSSDQAWLKGYRDMGEEWLKGIALVGGSIAWYGAPALNDDLRDSIIIFLKSFIQLETPFGRSEERKYYSDISESQEKGRLRKRVEEGVYRMARVEGVAAELGEAFLRMPTEDYL